MDRQSRTTVGYLGSEPLGEDRFGQALERANGVAVEAITEADAASDRRDAIDCLVCSHGEGVDGVALLETVRAQDRRLPVVLIAGPADASVSSSGPGITGNGRATHKPRSTPRARSPRTDPKAITPTIATARAPTDATAHVEPSRETGRAGYAR